MAFSFQLYSARNVQPWGAVFSQLAELGYASVEGYAALTDQADDIAADLKTHGLTMPSAHFGLDALEQDLSRAVSQAKTLGVQRIFAPYIDAADRPSDCAGWAGFAARLEALSGPIRSEGLSFGWHNHDFEFAALPDGTVPMQVVLDEAPSITWEADIAWIARGGADPFEWIQRYGSRITSAHVKDIAPAGEALDEDGWADVGHGTLDWPALTTALREAGCDLFIAEHDNPSDLSRFAGRSIEAFKTF
ncbi:MAG: sugar phosphate isomerase/epimerase [Pseudomonadota bacterium]